MGRKKRRKEEKCFISCKEEGEASQLQPSSISNILLLLLLLLFLPGPSTLRHDSLPCVFVGTYTYVRVSRNERKSNGMIAFGEEGKLCIPYIHFHQCIPPTTLVVACVLVYVCMCCHNFKGEAKETPARQVINKMYHAYINLVTFLMCMHGWYAAMKS